jgi:DNA-binding NarL/FixJ family response regulator
MAAVEEGDEEALEALDGLLLVLMRGYNRMNRRTGPTWTSRSEPSNALTDRERRVVQCAADGLNYQQTAELLCVDRETVKSHLQSAMRKLEASNTTQCVAVAARLGLV